MLLVCLSPNYLASAYCQWEWEHFLKRQGPKHLRGDGEAIQAVLLLAVPDSDAAQNQRWYDSVRRGSTIDLSPWFQQTPLLLQQNHPAQACAAQITESVSQRVRQARRELAREYGNLRAANEHFVGRQQQLRELHEAVGIGGVGVITALHGLGGIGKTELAVFYANDYARSFPAGLWWINAAPHRDLKAAIGTLAHVPGFSAEPTPPFSTDEQRFDYVMATLRQRVDAHAAADPDGASQVLILLDNVDHPELLGANQRTAVSAQTWLSLIATTRTSLQSWQQADALKTIALDSLDPDDALALLREWQPGHSFRDAADESAAKQLLRDLGCYTLAVEQAAIYLGTHPELRIDHFYSQLRRRGLTTLDSLSRDPDMQATMQHRDKQLALVLEQTLPQPGSLERTLLNYAACWGADALPLPWLTELLTEQHAELLQPSPESFASSDPIAAAVRWLEQRRLLTPNETPELRRMHRLVQAHLRQADATVQAVEAQIERERDRLEAENFRKRIEPWRIAALQAWAESAPGQNNRRRAATLAVLANWTLYARGPASAASLAKQSLQIFETLALADPSNAEAQRDVSASLHYVGQIQAAQGDATAALKSYQRSLLVREALALADPSNAQAQRDVWVSHSNFWQLATDRAEQIHHAQQVDRIFTELETRGAFISPGDRGYWDRIKQWLSKNTP